MGFKFVYPLASFVRNKKTFVTLVVIILLASAVLSNVKTVASLIDDPPITDIHSFPGQMVASVFSSNGTLFSGDNNYKLYRSNDNGTSFGLIYTFPRQSSPVGNSSGYVWTVFIDSRNYIFVSIPGTNRLYRSTTFGSTFTQVLNTNGTQNDGFYIALTEDSDGNLFTATYCNSLYPLQPAILKSTDGGESWTKIAEASTVHFHNIKFNPSNGYLYAITGEWGPGYNNQDSEKVFRSKDSGQNWNLIVNRTKQDDGYGDTIYFPILFDNNWVYLGTDQANRTNWIDRIYDDGSNMTFVPQRVYTFPDDCNFPVFSGVQLNDTMLFSSTSEFYGGVSRIIASKDGDGLNWQIIKSANISQLQHHTKMLTLNPKSLAFGSDGPGQTFAVGDISQSTPSPTVFSDGFETGNFNAWTGTGGAGTHSETVETSNPYLGSYDAKFTAGASSEGWAYKTITASNITDLRQYIRLETLPAYGNRLFIGSIQSGSSQNTMDAYIENVNGTYYWGVYSTINGAVYMDHEYVSSHPTTGVYYSVETCRDVTNGRSYSLPQIGSSNIIYSGISGAENAATIYIDSVEVSTSYIGLEPTDIEPAPTPTPTSSPTPTPTPNVTVYLGFQINMTATVAEPDYTESNTSMPIEASWIANDGTLYASSKQTLNKSPDQGQTWQSLITFNSSNSIVFDAAYVNKLNYIFISPNSNASEGDLGLWRSTDSGQTWNRTLALPLSCSIWGIDEDSNGNMFAGVYTRGETVSNARIYRSTDAGATWVSVYYGGSTVRHVHDIAVDKNNNYIYASIGDKYLSWTAYMIRSTDGGNTWSQILNGIPQMVAIETIPGARLFGTDDPMSGNGSIFRTSDDTNYQKVLDTGKDSYGLWFRTNPLNGRIYASFVSGEHSPSTAWIFTSDDNGLNWEIYKTFNVSTPYYGSICASNFNQGIMYYGVKLDSQQYGVKIHPSFTGTLHHAYSEDESKLSLPTQTFYNDSDAPLESNISDAASPSADLPILSSDEASWVPLSLGTVAVSTVLPANSIKSQGKRTFRRWKKS